MPKVFFIVLALFIFIVIPTKLTLAQGVIRIDSITPSFSPIPSSPTPTPTSPAPTNPIPPPSPPPLPNPPASPAPSSTPRFTSNICGYLTIVYLGYQSQGGQFGGKIYPSPTYIQDNPDEFLRRLKQDRNYINIEKEFNTSDTAIKIINSVLGGMASKGGDLDPSDPSIIDLKQKIGISSIASIAEFYLTLFKIMDHSLTISPFGTNAFFSSSGGKFFMTSGDISVRLANANWPELPVTMSFVSGLFLEDGGGVAYSKDVTLANLGCNNINPPVFYSATPLIHIYSKDNQEVTIEPEVEVTFASPDYSLVNGFKTHGNEEPLYYEFSKEGIEAGSEKEEARSREVVKGTQLRNYLLNELIPTLGLTSKEQEDFINIDILPQLENLTCHSREGHRLRGRSDSRSRNPINKLSMNPRVKPEDDNCSNYEVILYQGDQVNQLIPLTITPTPDTLIRNLIVVKQTNDLGFMNNDLRMSDFKNHKSNIINRKSFTIVENGFIIL